MVKVTSTSQPQRRGQRDAGVVLIIALLALVLIASLVFYVMNVGRHMQSRIEVQHAADAAVDAGAGWVARSMNTVAMNNVEMSRMVALVNVLDATDEALHPAWHEADAMYTAMQDQYDNMSGLSSREAEFIRGRMDPIINRYESDFNKLDAVKRLFLAPNQPSEYANPSGSLDVTRYTFHDSPGGLGMIWRTMYALDELNQATLAAMPSLAQLSAINAGRVNTTSEQTVSFLLPTVPTIPWERRTFGDFERPVRNGLLPEDVDDPRVNRGPYDTIFGWRRQSVERILIQRGVRKLRSEGTTGSGPQGAGGVGPTSRGPSYYWDPAPVYETNPTGYRVYGTQTYLLRVGRPDFYYSPFNGWRNRFANWKLQYLFDNLREQRIRLPIWTIDMNAAADLVGENPPIAQTRFFVARVESDVPRTSGSYLSPGTYRIMEGGRVVTLGGDWTRPNPCGNSPRVGNDPRYWQEQLDLWRTDCPQFARLSGDIRAQWRSAQYVRVNPSTWLFESWITRDDESKWQVAYYFFLGVDNGEEQEIRNPHNFASRSQLPAPIDLIHDQLGPEDLDARRQMLTFFSAVAQPNEALMWSKRFDQSLPTNQLAAVAQAHVFNNHSWDLWTQMWHSQLQPVDRYDDWADQLDANLNYFAAFDRLDEQQLEQVNALLDAGRDLAPATLRH